MGSTGRFAIQSTIEGQAELGQNVLNTTFYTTACVGNFLNLVAPVSTDGSSQVSYAVPSSASGVMMIPVNSTNPFTYRLRVGTTSTGTTNSLELSSRWPAFIGVPRSSSTGTSGVTHYLHTTSTGSSGVKVRVAVF